MKFYIVKLYDLAFSEFQTGKGGVEIGREGFVSYLDFKEIDKL